MSSVPFIPLSAEKQVYIGLGEVLLYDFFTMKVVRKRDMRFRPAIVLCS